MAVTVLLGLVAYAFIWADNEKVSQEVADFLPRSMQAKQKALTGDVMSGTVATGDVVTGAVATGDVATGTATTGAN